MKFGKVPLDAAQGAILAHSLRAGERRFKKGHRLDAGDVAQLLECGIHEAVVAQIEGGDVREDDAAARIAKAAAGENVRVAAAFTGRANLYTTAGGLAVVDAECVNDINAVDESITLATVPPFARVSPRQMLATVKIIPFAAPETAVEKTERLAVRAPIRVAAFRPRKAALILTTLPDVRSVLLNKTHQAIARRIEEIGSTLVFERQVPHEVDALSRVLKEAAAAADLVLVFGASAIADSRDVIPAAIEEAGGKIERFGMPVDPGNLLLLGKLDGTDVVGLPGCARSPKLNGFDFVLWRLAAGLPASSADIAAMGVGGLLMEIPVRPQPRDEPIVPLALKMGAIVLAAGTSSRMGANKLLTEIDGEPLVRRVVEAAIASGAGSVVVVTGNEAEHVQTALAGCDVRLVNNPDFSSGLSSSLRSGLKALPQDCDGAVILLGDMPAVTPALIDRQIATFDPAEGRAICVATHGGKRGNPVLFARRFFEEIEAIEGDVGARGLIGAYPELVCEVEAGSEAPLIDIDTPEDLAAYRRGRP